MIPSSFNYKKATSISEAIALLNSDANAKLLAGGHSLIPAMKLRLNRPSLLIDISKIGDLNFIRDRGKYIAIGAMTTHATIASHKTITAKLPMLAHAAELIGDIQVRNKGTIGGSIAHADPASDWPAVLIAAGATIVLQNANGERKVAADDFFTGFFFTALAENEIVTEIQVPDPTSAEGGGTSKAVYVKFMQPASRFAIVGCAVNVTVEGRASQISEVRVAFNGVADHAYRAKAVEQALMGQSTVGSNNVQELISKAAAHATEGASMIMSDSYADEGYRAHLAKVMCKRALDKCI